jgi:hypothetical protein
LHGFEIRFDDVGLKIGPYQKMIGKTHANEKLKNGGRLSGSPEQTFPFILINHQSYIMNSEPLAPHAFHA